jgi:hypothetical protein
MRVGVPLCCSNPALVNISASAFQGLKTSTQTITISTNAALRSVLGFANLRTMTGALSQLTITGNREFPALFLAIFLDCARNLSNVGLCLCSAADESVRLCGSAFDGVPICHQQRGPEGSGRILSAAIWSNCFPDVWPQIAMHLIPFLLRLCVQSPIR